MTCFIKVKHKDNSLPLEYKGSCLVVRDRKAHWKEGEERGVGFTLDVRETKTGEQKQIYVFIDELNLEALKKGVPDDE